MMNKDSDFDWGMENRIVTAIIREIDEPNKHDYQFYHYIDGLVNKKGRSIVPVNVAYILEMLKEHLHATRYREENE